MRTTQSRSSPTDISKATKTPADPTPRRRSQRAVKPPQKFATVVVPNRVEIATPKRKRSDAESDSTDPEEKKHTSPEEEDAHEESSVVQRRSKRIRKPTAKKLKLIESLNITKNNSVSLPSRLKKNINRRVVIADKDAGGLYAELFLSGNRPQDVASQWLHRYQKNNRHALTDLVNLVLRSSGCNIEITVDDIDDVDNVDGRLADVQNEFLTQNIADYPLVSRAKSSQSFRAKLTGFFDKLIEVMHESEALYEETVLLENIHQWIAALSSSTTRPFRHTATLVALTMTSARCRIAHKEIEIAAKVQRQLENEVKNKRPNKARISDFQRRVDKNNERKAVIESQIQDYFDTVYVHRYRDIDPKIRTECVEALGTWIVSLESYFFDGQYLRYMGWMLSDTHGLMRQGVVLQLQRIMKTVNPGGIRHFIDRFRPRLIEMAARDSEPVVRAHTVELLTMIRNAEMLEPDDIDAIGRLIFDTEPRVRKAVVNFFIFNINDLYEIRVQEIYGDEEQDQITNTSDDEDFDVPNPSWIKYKCLAEMLVEYDAHDKVETTNQVNSEKFLKVTSNESRFTLAAQALFEKMAQLKEWHILAGYLLYDHTSNARQSDNETESTFLESVKPTENEEIVLLEVLNAVVKPSFQQLEEPPKGDKKKQSKVELLEARETAVHQLANIITRLLKKYGADPQTVTIVLRLVHVLDLGCFNEMRQNSSICSRLLDEICIQFRSHADSSVLKEASTALLHIREYEELEEVTNSKIQSSWEENINMLQKINQAGEISIRGSSLNEKLLTELSHNLARLEQLSSISNSVEFMEGDSSKRETCPIIMIFDIIARGELSEGNEPAIDSLEDLVVRSAMRSGLFYFMWKTRTLATLISAGQDPSENEIDQLKEQKDIFVANLIAAFSSRADLDEVRLLGAGTLLDLHVTFVTTLGAVMGTQRKQATEESAFNPTESLLPFVKEIKQDVQQELVLIFCELERQFAKKSKKKLNSPDDDEAPEDLDSEAEDELDETNDGERQMEILAAEEKLCQFTGKLCLAILAQVIDISGPSTDKLRNRLLRNRNLLGLNFKEVVACLEEPKYLNRRKYQVISSPIGRWTKKWANSTEVIESDDNEEAVKKPVERKEQIYPFADDDYQNSVNEDDEVE